MQAHGPRRTLQKPRRTRANLKEAFGGFDVPTLRTYKVFISHAWHRSADYYRIVGFLDDAVNFRWINLSVPEHDPLGATDLAYEIRNQLRPSDAFLIVGGMYSAYSEWIDFEVSVARRIGRPIIGIWKRGGVRLPRIVERSAIEVVGWNGNSIVRAIRQHALPAG